MQEWTARASELFVLILFASKMALKMQIYLDSGPQEIFSVVSCKTGSGTRKVIGKHLIQNNLVQIRMLLARMLKFLKLHSWISKLHLDLRKDFHKQSLLFLIADFFELRGQSSAIWVPIFPKRYFFRQIGRCDYVDFGFMTLDRNTL